MTTTEAPRSMLSALLRGNENDLRAMLDLPQVHVPEPEQAAPEPVKRKRRKRGTGTIYQRSDGVWAARMDVGKDENGKRLVRYVYGSTMREAKIKLNKIRAEKASTAASTYDATVMAR